MNTKTINIQTVDPALVGDLGRLITAAMENYDESIKDYPTGCVLALREVKNMDLLIWGEDYVIETSEFRITKRIQRGSSDEFIQAYSTNRDTHPDGRIVHEPLDIRKASIKKLYRVMGYIVAKTDQLRHLSTQ